MGSQLMKSWSSTQPVITLSSGEAELYGVVRAAANGLGYLSLLADFGIKIPMRVWTDSTASNSAMYMRIRTMLGACAPGSPPAEDAWSWAHSS